MRYRRLALAFSLALALPAAAAEYSASGWQDANGARVRLIVPDTRQGAAVGAVELRLPPATKTYWRTPGETGVPTVAEFAGSSGITAPTLLYPAPTAFDDGAGGIAYGYLTHVVFPVHYVATGAEQVSVQLSFGLCTKNMCLPAQANLSLKPGNGTGSSDLAGRVAAASAAVPRPVAAGADGAIAILEGTHKSGAKPAKVVITARLPKDAGDPSLFAEGEAPLATKLVRREGEMAEFTLRADGPDLPLRGAVLLTLVTGAHAIETKLDLDALPKRP